MPEWSGVLVLEDDILMNSICFVKHILSKMKSNNVEVICVEKASKKWKNLCENVKTIQIDDPRKWKGSLITSLNSFNYKVTLIIDSINQLSSLIGWDCCLKFLKQLRENPMIENAIVLFHSDCLLNGNKMIKHLQYISQTYIRLLLLDTRNYQLDITISAVGGKVKRTIERVYYDSEIGKWVAGDVKQVAQAAQHTDTDCNPADFASFKISVDDAAQIVKNNMVLPYTEIAKSEGKIIYHHDGGDDWDDEDPDDDLDF